VSGDDQTRAVGHWDGVGQAVRRLPRELITRNIQQCLRGPAAAGVAVAMLPAGREGIRVCVGEQGARWVMTLMMCPRCGGMVPEPLPTDIRRDLDTCTRCGLSYRERRASPPARWQAPRRPVAPPPYARCAGLAPPAGRPRQGRSGLATSEARTERVTLCTDSMVM